jgi:hypothetical protein
LSVVVVCLRGKSGVVRKRGLGGADMEVEVLIISHATINSGNHLNGRALSASRAIPNAGAFVCHLPLLSPAVEGLESNRWANGMEMTQ